METVAKSKTTQPKKRLHKVRNPYGYVIHHLKYRNHFPALRKRKSPSTPSILRNTAMNSFDFFSTIRFDYSTLGEAARERKVIKLSDFEKQDKRERFKPTEQDIQQRMAVLRAREKKAKSEALLRTLMMRMQSGIDLDWGDEEDEHDSQEEEEEEGEDLGV